MTLRVVKVASMTRMFEAVDRRDAESQASSASHALHPMAVRAAATNCALLLTGETGTGKGYMARWIHDHSNRAAQPFVPVNCGAIPQDLVDSHLFGHARGAFSGAACEHLGLVRASHRGTLLLDEISELPATAQLRLLRLLEEREVQPVGYSKPVKVDVRIIAGTNADLRQAVELGRFRRDLFFRLDIVGIELKPLRERTDDIVPLLQQFNREFAATYQQPALSFDAAALRIVQDYDWPGNVRELRSLMERLHVLIGAPSEPPRCVTANDLRTFGQLRLPLVHDGWNVDRARTLRTEVVNQALSACRGNMSRAALSLGVHRSTLYRWRAGQAVAA